MPHRAWGRAIVVVAAASATCLVGLGTASAVPGATAASSMPVDASWPTPTIATPHALACPTVARCTAIVDAQGLTDPSFVESEHGVAGRWSAPVHLPVPAGAVAGYAGIGCATPTTCTAVGVGVSSATSHLIPVVAALTSGTWALAGPVPVPPGATDAELTAVWCGASTCVATGAAGTTAATRAFVDVETAGTWGAATTLPTPVGPKGARAVLVDPASIACTSATACTVVGSFTIANTAQYGVADVLRDGTWTTRTFAPGRTVDDALSSVACATASACVAVGSVSPSTAHGSAPYAVSFKGGRWSDGTILAWRYWAPSTLAGALSGVSCTSATRCVAVGHLDAVAAHSGPAPTADQGTYAATYADRGGHWTPAGLVTPPPVHGDRSVVDGAELSAIACPTASACVTTGFGAVHTSSSGAVLPFSAELVPTSRGSAPSAPTSVRVGLPAGALDVSWHGPSVLGGSVITTFVVVARSPGEPSITCATVELSCRLAAAATGHRYTVDVTARNAAGNDGPTARTSATAR